MRRISRFIKKLKYNYIAFRYLLSQEKESKSKLRIRFLFRGFSGEKYQLYDFKNNNYILYLSDYQRRKTAKINGAYSLIINDKNLFSKIYTRDNITAKVFGTLRKGNIVIDNQVKEFNDLIDLAVSQKKLIIKKYRGGGGKGIYKLTYKQNSFYLDDQLINHKELGDFIKGLSNHQIVEHLTQANYSNAIYSGTINSIRILTMIDPYTEKVFVPIAVHKFGSETTKPVDNVWNGGMTALIDLDTGRLGRSAYHHENNNKIEWRSTHPDTKVEIEGTMIPGWQQVLEKVKNIAQLEDNLKYVGWDVVVTNDGVKIIEGNNYSDVNILQIHQPLLADERVKRFYKYHKIIK